MSRINTNVPSLIGRIHLSRSNQDLQLALDRLSTGLRINSGRDDPAGLIASEQFASGIGSVRKAISNTQQADHIIATANSALGQISRLLNDIRGLVTEAANRGALSDDQVAANQLQIDSSLEAIDRIVAITSFQGKKLLDGSLEFLTSGVSTGNIANLVINQATLPASGNLSLTLNVTTAAAKATVTGSNANLAQTFVVEVAGTRGIEVFTFDSGTTPAQIVSAINLVSDAIGVDASLSGTGAYVLTSKDYGANAFVEIRQITSGGSFAGVGPRTYGVDVGGNINGEVVHGSWVDSVAECGNARPERRSDYDIRGYHRVNLIQHHRWWSPLSARARRCTQPAGPRRT
jgi:flagellin-like hook-associated protein FlgL